jgi:DNA-binding NarL/FixJ family response regulator
MSEEGGLASHAFMLQTFLLTGSGPVSSVLVCDDRPDVQRRLADVLLLLPGTPSIAYLSHGFALVEHYTRRPADIVLVGIHRGSNTGAEAVTMLIKTHPDAAVIVFGVAADSELLADVFVRGARGLVLWDPFGG